MDDFAVLVTFKIVNSSTKLVGQALPDELCEVFSVRHSLTYLGSHWMSN